ncbi:7tm 7 domain containing protein, partial [Asbolus verrucosus]
FHYYGIAGRSSLELKFNSITGVADTVHLYGISVVVLSKMNTIFLGFFVLAIIFLLAVECMNCSLFISTLRAYSSNCFLMCFSSLMIIMLEEFKFFTYFLLLKYRFKIINLLLRHHFPMNENEEIINYYKIYPKTPPKCDKEMMVKLRSLHLQLCFVGKLLNEYFSMQILLLIGFSFVGFTTNAYYSFDVIFDNFVNNDGNLGVIPSTVIWTATKFTELLFISVVCTITKNEANQTGEILYRIKNRYKKNVASQIIHSNFKITAFDFFDIDMTLFF